MAMRIPVITALGYAALAVVCVALVSAGFFNMPQVNDWLFRACMLIIISTSWNLMATAGLVSLGHSAFWGIGSYAAVMAANGLNLPLAGGLAAGILAGMLVGAGLALATGRLRGIFFAIATLALSEGLRVTAMMLPDVTGGAMGVYLKPALRADRPMLFVVASVTMIASVALAALLARTRFHFACRAMRNDESAAQMLGLDPLRYRIGILAVSSAMAAAAGTLSTWYGGYLDPDVGFNLHMTIESQIAPILGGMYSVVGPVIGAIIIEALSEFTRIKLGAQEGVSQLAYGFVLVLCVSFMPRGVYGAWQKLRMRWPAAAAVEAERPGEALS